MTSKIIGIVCALLLLVGVIVTLGMLEDTIDVKEKQTEVYRPSVTVTHVTPGTHSGEIHSFAEIQPHWSADIKAHVSGEIIEIAPQALAGESVQKGDILIRIEGSQYKADFEQAKYNLAQAQLQLQIEEKQTKRAYSDWKRSGLKQKPSDLTLNKPQLKLAQNAVTAAQSAVKATQQSYSYTTIRAPFSGVVSARYVSIGQTVHPGDPILHLLDNNTLDIEVSLSTQQWNNLSPNWQSILIPIKNSLNQTVANARIKRRGGFIDPQSRQYKLFLDVDQDNNKSLLPGQFVHIDLPVRELPNTLVIPESALTREGLVWYVDQQKRLRSFASEVKFYQPGNLVVTVPTHLSDSQELQIALNPLASFISGKEVAPTTKSELKVAPEGK